MSLRTRVLRVLAAATSAAAVLAPMPAAAPSAAPVFIRHLSGGHAVSAGTTVTLSNGASFAFSAVVGGKPVRWNPCAAIHWRAYTAHAPVGGLDVLKSAVNNIAYRTGTTWIYDGATTTVPRTSYLPTTPTQKPVLIGWTDGAHSDLLAGRSASTLGMTRTTWFGKVTSTGTVAATRGAVIALDRTDSMPLRGANSWRTVALHELGHAMGLAHPNDSGELMNAVLPRTLNSMQVGDQAGLYRLGRSQGCISF